MCGVDIMLLSVFTIKAYFDTIKHDLYYHLSQLRVVWYVTLSSGVGQVLSTHIGRG